MSTKPAATLGDTHMGREITVTGRLIGLIPVSDRIRIEVLADKDTLVEIHKETT